MGHSQASKQSTHERIVGIAAERFCELGIDGLSIANLMKEAGLTHGGFYKHFESRDQLVAEALVAAFQRSDDRQRTYQSTFETLVSEYLSTEHRDAVGTGCAVGALVSDIGRVQGEARNLYTQKLRTNIKGISALVGTAKGATRADAIVAFSAMVGALGLSRAVADDELSLEILSTVREFLLSNFGTNSQD
ncbi:TetR/AcrR family transcriptional regulator [Pseudomonas aeruginosa]|uniref:TetR/AcrR family transcriptional regulator n=1 Tax=Pseudomonas aeruginosa TaxID=287 RepID=UPI000D703858|nr:TetR/AcrR family transcriptional regulator [Pseudomonas aeruginosa]ELK4918974.1 TetR/AcrR family transcriptional regulator [Pseudomonas aeruginosa]MCP9254299.1 TetR/AcrR family transcriptional regulator [Pseudomonas aeruginosa]MCS8549166.1 TetR/AcrR family transcriptional regulator [Pseudomonas aeruginosa]MCT1239330.1 TetR/AcrR family transcriptional regulator [Pseudomonas aeruginosa]MDA3425343.1 TetR/AcrR family transcriptional regulator [Pseudomonas aeruginosa]